MDVNAMLGSVSSTLGNTLPGLVGVIGVPVIGWIVAVVLRAGVRRLLRAAEINARIASSTEGNVNAES